jgi:transcriptional repressor of cell division inhibition gene dicB
MKTDQAIQHAGGAKALAELLGITPSAISQWGDDIPEPREWQLRVLRPAWFDESAPKAAEWDGRERRSQSRG